MTPAASPFHTLLSECLLLKMFSNMAMNPLKIGVTFTHSRKEPARVTLQGFATLCETLFAATISDSMISLRPARRARAPQNMAADEQPGLPTLVRLQARSASRARDSVRCRLRACLPQAARP